MKAFHRISLCVCSLFSTTLSAPPLQAKPELPLQEPAGIVEHYHFKVFTDSPKKYTALFVFENEDVGDKYSIRLTADGKIVAKDISYIKTFGGRESIIKIHVINSRFIVFPETVPDSEIPGTQLHDMMAFTRIYDIKTQQIINSSDPYQYNHNIPLRYDLDSLLWLLKREAP